IFLLNPKGLMLVTGDPVASQFSVPDAEDGGTTALGGCAAGISGFSLLSDGTVLPCRRLPVSLGNVREDSVREIWATSEVLNSLRDRSRYKGKCASCPRWASCRGCRAIAYAHSGKILSE
ncbi:MAG: SPASM domain-containing protein, partial [Armatimonadetes bacterium]|nr:SPASM domain-containing protein [Armatimonadota bacterium]NIO96655.1 SPASM domain-containing protein [Armatimonadota bacterium]